MMRRVLFTTLTLLFAALVAIAGFIIIVDPHQHYHRNATYSGIQRYEIGGVAAHHDYDAFVTGSSMAMNHFTSQIDSVMGWKTKNFTFMGAAYDDYAIALPYILKQGKTKNVIWGIDFFSLTFRRNAMPGYMYDDNLLTDCKYLWNFSILTTALKMYRTGGVSDSIIYHFNSPANRAELLRCFFQKTNNRLKDISHSEIYALDTMRRHFDEIIVPVISSHPEVQWWIYLPPYSIAEFIIFDQDGYLDDITQMRAYMADRLLKLSNVALFDFQREPWITDLNAYMDTRHHSHAFNRNIIHSIKNNCYRVNLDSVRHNNSQLTVLVKQYTDSLNGGESQT